LLIAALSACVSAPQPPRAEAARVEQDGLRPVTNTWPIKPVANPPRPYEDIDQRETPSPALVAVIRNLGQSFNGHVGIAVKRIGADWTVAYNGNQLFPQQSVSKLWVSMAFLDAVDRGRISLSDAATITRGDLTLFHQPTAAMLGSNGSWTTTYADLMKRAMTQSDNTANDTLLRAVGGPEAVRSFLARRYIRDIRFGPGERLLQATTAGLEWRQDYSVGRNFYAARNKLPMAARERALDNYLASPPDGAAPASIVAALAKLKQNQMISPRSAQILMSFMEEAKTGPQRIKGGVPHTWRYMHKTGTGQELNGRATGFNDVGIMTAPDGTSYAVAVMIGETRVPIPTRWALEQAVAQAIVANHQER
jgi:beta-lactamase class A